MGRGGTATPDSDPLLASDLPLFDTPVDDVVAGFVEVGLTGDFWKTVIDEARPRGLYMTSSRAIDKQMRMPAISASGNVFNSLGRSHQITPLEDPESGHKVVWDVIAQAAVVRYKPRQVEGQIFSGKITVTNADNPGFVSAKIGPLLMPNSVIAHGELDDAPMDVDMARVTSESVLRLYSAVWRATQATKEFRVGQ